jgi:septal ring factor EnvC (AmiA/AmiB activator)
MIHRSFFILFILVFSVSTTTLVLASSDKQKTHDNLNQIEQKIVQQNKQLQSSQAKQTEASKAIKNHQTQLITISKKLVALETQASAIEQNIAELIQRKDHLTDIIQKSGQQTGDLIILLTRLKRTPPANIITQSDDPLKTARADLLLSRSLPAVRQKLNFLTRTIQELEVTQNTLQDKHQTITKILSTRQEEQAVLEKALTLKKNLLAQTKKQNHLKEQEIRQLAAKANDLKDLIKTLERNEQKQRHFKTSLSLPRSKPLQKESIEQSRGLPVAGLIQTQYNQKDEFGITAKGITINPLDKALVVSPWDGTVRFSGPFKRYQNLVIIEHSNNLMSLIGGLNNLYVATGQTVLSNEPLGQAFPDKKHNIYYELRKKGRIVNPLHYTSKLTVN